MQSQEIIDELNILLSRLSEIEKDKNSEWFKDFPYDANLRAERADALEDLLDELFEEHQESKEPLTKEDFFYVYLGWILFVSSGIALDVFESTYNIGIVARANEFSDYATKSSDTSKFNEMLKYDLDITDTLKMSLSSLLRSRDMARTETLMLSNQMVHETARSEYTYHMWVSERDDRVRLTHVIADGQVKPIDEPFEVGDSLLLYPGDMSLGASQKETILCRCHEEFIK